MRGTQHNRYPKVRYNTVLNRSAEALNVPTTRNRSAVALCRSAEALKRECRSTNHTCLFIHYPVLGRHIIIYITELVILFLVTFLYLDEASKEKGKKTNYAQKHIRRGDEVRLGGGTVIKKQGLEFA